MSFDDVKRFMADEGLFLLILFAITLIVYGVFNAIGGYCYVGGDYSLQNISCIFLLPVTIFTSVWLAAAIFFGMILLWLSVFGIIVFFQVKVFGDPIDNMRKKWDEEDKIKNKIQNEISI